MLSKTESVSSRIELVMQYYNFNYTSFSKKLKLTNNVTIGRLIKENRNPSFDILNRIAVTFPEINCKWLLTGEGNMKNDSSNLSNIELINNLIDQNENLLKDEDFRKYIRANIKRLQAEDLRSERIIEMKKLKDIILKKQNTKE
ncbi:hypothetical protein [Aquimarina algiphila]|uniref:hypothetical protein n=1 Tax=Aquimarina algiphila TaxID=2047982 RepID=UPI00232C7BEA|nr:hypothetical protein [Aquimarina algiphila]